MDSWKKFDFRWLAPFKVIREDGVEPWAIVTYRKTNWKYRWDNEVIQYRKAVMINLWIIHLRFSWLTKEKKNV